MYPGPDDPDFGAFIAQVVGELEAQGHEIERAVIDRRDGSRLKHAGLALRAVRLALRRRPDVVYAHFLFPAGLSGTLASLAARAPLAVMAHGRDVRNVGEIRGVRAATRLVMRRAGAVIANSAFLRDDLVRRLPELEGRVEVIDYGVDLERFFGRDPGEARAALGLEGEGPHFLFVGTFDERKNVLRLAEAFERVGRGTLVMVGDGPLRAQLEGRAGITVAGRVAHERLVDWMAACDVLCLPSTVEPFGQVLLEAMACERSVVATSVGGPPEFVPPEAGAIVDPTSVESIAEGMRRAAELGTPNPAARSAAAERSSTRQAARVGELLERLRAEG